MKRSDKRWLVKWAAIWLLAAAVMALLSCESSAAVGEETRQASAQFRQVDATGCIETVTGVSANQTATTALESWPDGWARSVWLTVEVVDTCNSIDLMRAGGQAVAQTLDVDRKLGSGQLATWVTLIDQVSSSMGRVYVTVSWTGTGPVQRNVFRTVSRSAEATLTTDGMVTLRNATTEATLSIHK